MLPDKMDVFKLSFRLQMQKTGTTGGKDGIRRSSRRLLQD
jgi:hypothetical protein